MRILLTTKNRFNLFSWFIKKWMKTKFSHAGLVFDLYGVELVFEATAFFGVRIVTYENFMNNNIIIEVINIADEQKAKKAIAYCFRQLGDQYNFMSVLGIAFKDPKLGVDGENSFQCSELIARAFELRYKSLDHIDVKELKELINEQK